MDRLLSILTSLILAILSFRYSFFQLCVVLLTALPCTQVIVFDTIKYSYRIDLDYILSVIRCCRFSMNF